MRNVIVFINICIVASVTMLLLDFERTPEAAVSLASMTPAVDQELVTSTSTPTPRKKKETLLSTRVMTTEEEQVVREFVSEMTQLRLLERERSKAAAQRSTRRALKDFGAWMVIHQQQMLDDLNRIGQHYRWSDNALHPSPATSMVAEFENLHGKKFDVHYIKAMTSTLKADVKRLEKASYSSNPEIKVFAARYLSITKDNLNKLQRIRKMR